MFNTSPNASKRGGKERADLMTPAFWSSGRMMGDDSSSAVTLPMRTIDSLELEEEAGE